MNLIKFSAGWCSPCKQLEVALGNTDHPLAKDYRSVDIDNNTELTKLYNVRGVPTLILEDDEGNELRRLTGMQTPIKLLAFLSA